MTTTRHNSIFALAVSAIALIGLAGCASSAPAEPDVATVPVPAASPSPTGSFDTMAYQPDAAWECGYVSALETANFHASSLLSKGTIDRAAYDARQVALQQAWSVIPRGSSPVTPTIRAAESLADAGELPSSDAFRHAAAAITDACEANRAPVIIGSLAVMGG
ncbi:hypothetical protein ITJ43_13425 [Microbacterium sp. VKM Ac-2870]|uniref:hypothetical protein n=1 Tax=Microbacterium sp. VKM Ac-2870 TaxID=2783825 RepID=UPI00188D414C|nr:hypothetical protein [Microbacterium sp. VKM Ac-2870]MBF4563133.1 hypothetical protein [Microbacterium sp. VKM Ac-2870]